MQTVFLCTNIIMVLFQLHLLPTIRKVVDVHSYLSRQSTSLHISYARTNQGKNTIKKL